MQAEGLLTKSRFLLILIVLMFITAVYGVVLQPVFRSTLLLPALPGGIMGQTLPLVLFTLSHAIYTLGWRHALAFFSVSTIVSWTFEHLGVASGVVYGGYSYTEVLGPRLGHVPVLIPLSWFMYLYPGYIVVNCILSDEPVGSQGGLVRVLWLSAVGAVVTTAQDLVFDPILSGPIVSAWIWNQGGGYFGVPVHNFLGWIATSFIVLAVYRTVEWRAQPRPMGTVTAPVLTIAIISYAFLVVAALLGIGPSELKVIGPFVLGLPTLFALTRVWSGVHHGTRLADMRQ